VTNGSEMDLSAGQAATRSTESFETLRRAQRSPPDSRRETGFVSLRPQVRSRLLHHSLPDRRLELAQRVEQVRFVGLGDERQRNGLERGTSRDEIASRTFERLSALLRTLVARPDLSRSVRKFDLGCYTWCRADWAAAIHDRETSESDERVEAATARGRSRTAASSTISCPTFITSSPLSRR
jgi:hypothetical protein